MKANTNNLRTFCVSMTLFMMTLLGVNAQTINLSNQAVASLASIRTEAGGAPDRAWAAFFNPGVNRKTAQLLAFCNSQMGGNFRPIPSQGFRTYLSVGFRKGNGLAAKVDFNVTIIPLVGVSTRYAGGSAALICYAADKVNGIYYPRLLLRKGAAWGSAVEEYSYHVSNQVVSTSNRKGNSLLNSCFRLLSATNNGGVSASLKNAWDQSVYRVGSTVTDSLRAVLDVRGRSVGQGSMALAQALLFESNLNGEFSAGYVDGAIDASQSFSNGDSLSAWIKTQLQNLLKDILRDLVSRVIGVWLLSLF